jgi:hypothetical protein
MNRKLYLGRTPEDEEVGEVTPDGMVYSGKGIHKEIKGQVSEDGRVYQGTGTNRKYVGRVDEDGRIYSGQGILERVVGHVDSNGSVYENSLGISVRKGLELPIGQIRDSQPPAGLTPTTSLRDEIIGNWREDLLGKGFSKPESKPSRVLPEGAALLLLLKK